MATILVVEDDTHLREDIAEILAFKDYTVITAQNGREGLNLARQHSPDLIVSDIMMPELDGFGLLLALREDKDMAFIPFIFLTARIDYADQRKGMSIGADDYLLKPFNPIDLLNSVKIRLDKQAELKRRTDQEINTLRNSVVNMMPHELRTPLTGIIGYVDLLVNDYEAFDSKQILQMLQTIQKSGYRLYHIIQNYLLFAQLEIMGLDPERRTLIAEHRNEIEANPTEVFTRIAHEKASHYNRAYDLTLELAPGIAHILKNDLEKSLKNWLTMPSNSPSGVIECGFRVRSRNRVIGFAFPIRAGECVPTNSKKSPGCASLIAISMNSKGRAWD